MFFYLHNLSPFCLYYGLTTTFDRRDIYYFITNSSTKALNMFSPNHRTRFLFSDLFGDDPVSDFSLHMLRAPCSALWVVGCGPLVTPIFPTCLWALRSTLCTMGQPRPRVQHRIHCSDAAYATFISKFVQQPSSSTRSTLFFMERTQSPISPYTCHGLRALCHGWSAVVPVSCLLLLHMHELHARCYGLWVGQGHKDQ